MPASRWIAGLVAALALAAAGCGDGAGSPAAPERDGAEPAPVPFRTDGLDRVVRAQGSAAEAARQRSELERLAAVPTTRAALRRAYLSGAIGRREWRSYRAVLAGARRAARRLDGARQAELRSVIGVVDQLAHDLRLTPSRLPAVFLDLRRNTRTWTQAPFPAAAERRTFGNDPAVFQYVPGHGMQLHPLATWGRINWRLRRCLETHGRRCAERRLRRELDRLARLAARRGGFVTWEYYYAWAQGSPPWMSGMTQATAVQALMRAARALHRRRYARLARHALGAFATPPPTGVAVPAPGGTRYVMYSFAPSLRILNGELQAVNGLREAAALGHDARAAALARAGDRAARAAIPGFDTGAWSLYSSAGSESTLSYHELTTTILGQLCKGTGRPEYCDASRRFRRYEREPPRIDIAPLRGLRARRIAPLRFTLSKGSSVRVRVYGPHGVVLARDLALGRGGHELSWTPPSRGRFHVRVSARGPEGKLGVTGRAVHVTLPKPKPKPKPKSKPKSKPKRSNDQGPGGAGGKGDKQSERGRVGDAAEPSVGGVG
jgi:D-glucuronyl C5-epimerase C-terminus